jgi:hypothetical protein
MKQYIGIIRDHSGSMRFIGHLAMKDYNEQIASIKENAIRYGIDTIVSSISSSIRMANNTTGNQWDATLSSIAAVKKMTSYATDGSKTVIFDAIDMMVNQFKNVPDYNSDDVAFSVMVLTDGEDTHSFASADQIGRTIKQLQATDKWTISFRVPHGMKAKLVAKGIPAGNILEVDYSSEESIEKATVLTKSAIATSYSNRTVGIRSTSAFYADTSNLTQQDVRGNLANISKRVNVLKVPQAYDGYKIQDFVEEKVGGYILGSAYYQLTKRETVEDSKNIVVWNKLNGEYYSGAEARSLLGFPSVGAIKVVPGNTPNFEVFIQSRSVNRKLVGGTKLVVFKSI